MKVRSIVGIVLTVTLLSSCGTTKSVDAGGVQAIVRGGQENPSKLGEKQFLSVTTPIENPQYMEQSNWSKVRATSSVLDVIGSHKYFSNSEKVQFLSYLFDELPINGPDGVVREVHVGKFFEDGQNLTLRIGVLTPGADAELKSDKVIMILTNMFRFGDFESKKKTGEFISLDLNESILFSLQGSLLTDAQYVSDDESPVDITTLNTIDQVMLAQTYLRDNNLENDIIADEIVNKIIEKKQEAPALIIMAMIFKYDYLLSIEDITQAEVLWKEILDYSPNVPGDMTPENLEALNGESLYMMKSLLGYFEK